MPAGSAPKVPVWVLAAVAAVVAATGCGGASAGPVTMPSPLPTVAPSAAPSAAAVHISPRQQVRAVVARYFHLLNRLHVDMGYAALAELFTPDCPCQEQVQAVRVAAAKGERYLDRIRLNALRTNLDGPRAADVLADYQLVRGGLVDASGRRLTRNPPHRVRWDFRLRRVGGRWRIARIDDLS